MDTNERFKAIKELDLDAIKVKLMHEESGEGWSLEKANAVEFEYRRFLILMKQFPQEETAPLMDVDTFWHYHILDTMKYAQDCQQIFGYFLHHFPYLGLRGEDDEAAHQRVGERMKQLYEQTFGEDYLRPGRGEAAAFSGQVAQAGQTAFSGMVAQTAFSGQVAKTAFSGQVATAFSGQVAKTAFSGQVAKVAFSGQVAKQVAFSGQVPQVAFSGMVAQKAQGAETAFSGQVPQVAFSGMVSQPVPMASSLPEGSIKQLYASRPSLPGQTS